MSERPWEIAASVALDGELDPTETLELLDAMADDEECRSHWRRLRAVDRELDAVVRPATRSLTARGRRPGILWWAAPLAAAALFAVLLLRPDPGPIQSLPDPEGQPLTIRLSDGESGMTDHRFVQLVVEVLKSDQRYQQKMLEVLEEVRPEASLAEAGSGEGEPESRERLVLGHEEGPDSGEGGLPWEALAGIH